MLLSDQVRQSAKETLLPRPRLIDRIRRPRVAPITMITAPAGHGKSTLAAQWSQQTSHDVVWMSLGPEHNDPDVFHRQLASVVSTAVTDDRAQPAQESSTHIILDRLATRTDAQPPLMIVLDDLHHIVSDEIDRILTRLLTTRIPDVRWMILYRTTPRLTLARMRAEGQVREIGMDSLSFDRSEVAAIASVLLSRPFPDDQAGKLVEATGGWIAGIRLALLAAGAVLPDSDDVGLIGADVDEWIDTYVTEEVLTSLSGDLQDFVLRTSGFPYLTPEFTNVVAETSAGERMLSSLEKHFIIRRRVTESGPTMEYAAWIAKSLQRIAVQRLTHEDRGKVRERAAEFLLSHGEHALALETAHQSGDLSLQIRIVRKLHTPLALEDRTVKIRNLLDTLPAAVIRQHPDLAYSYAHALFHRGDTSALASLVSEVVPGWRTSTDPVIRGYARNCKAFVLYRAGDTAGALQRFGEALEQFPRTQYRERLHALAGVFETASELGEDATAERAVEEAAACTSFLPHHQVTWWMNIHSRLVYHHAIRGNISLAHELLDHARRNLPSTFRRHLPYFDFLIAALRFEAHDLASAEELISSSFDGLAQGSHDNWHADALALGARIAQANGQRDLATARLKEAHSKAARFGNQHDLMQVETIQASWDIEDGNPIAAHAWENYWNPHNRRWIQTFGQLNATATLLQLRIAEQRYDDAIALCEEALVEGCTRQRRVELISIMMWGAIALERAGRSNEATAMRQRALEARREDAITRAFVTPGHEPGPAFRRAMADHEPGEMAPVDDQPGIDSDPDDADIRLTTREREVIHLLADSLSNQDISERLFITERTVKKHVSNILRKLDVPNRTAIVVHARERGWIDR